MEVMNAEPLIKEKIDHTKQTQASPAESEKSSIYFVFIIFLMISASVFIISSLLMPMRFSKGAITIDKES